MKKSNNHLPTKEEQREKLFPAYKQSKNKEELERELDIARSEKEYRIEDKGILMLFSFLTGGLLSLLSSSKLENGISLILFFCSLVLLFISLVLFDFILIEVAIPLLLYQETGLRSTNCKAFIGFYASFYGSAI